MKNLNSTSYNKKLLDWVLFAARIFIGVAMITHGFPKLMQLLSGKEIEFINLFGIGKKTSLILAVLAEVLCSLFLIMGLFTRIALIPLIITMLVAAIMVHGGDPFAKQEMSLLYLCIYLLLLVTGPGKFSIDRMINKK